MVFKKYKKINILIITLIFLFAFFTWQNNDIVITEYNYENGKIPVEFNGYEILQISDLHNKSFGKDNSHLLNHVKTIAPDIIVITGDFIDRRNSDIEISLDFARLAVNIAPVYYVSGNHENGSAKYEKLKSELEYIGVKVLDNKIAELKIRSSSINLIGIKDYSFYDDEKSFPKDLQSLVNRDQFNILLSHRPELMDIYVESGVDLSLTGHTHGGQIRLPLIGGIASPDQGLFPKYDSDIHLENTTSMIVSRGLGNSIIPVRVFNRPELVVINLFNEN